MPAVETKVRELADSLTREDWDLLWSLSATGDRHGVPPELQAKLQASADALSPDERAEVRLLGSMTDDEAEVGGYMVNDDHPDVRLVSSILTQYF